ncbi:MAG: ankyrin repeat domain-containing protein [Wolbachia sp.]
MKYQFKYEQVLETLSIVSAKDDLNESNIIEKIKEELRSRTPYKYQEWRDNEFNIDYTHNDQFMLLHVAASGLVKVTELLTNIGADVNVATKAEGLTPLHIAAEKGHMEIVDALIKQKENVNAEDKEGVTPLHLDAVNGHVEIANALLKEGADPLFGNRSFRTLKSLVKLIKNDSLDGTKKAEETQRKKEQVDDEYELLKFSFLFRNNRSLIDVSGRKTFDNFMCTWLADVSDLTPDQKKLNGKLLNILKYLPYCSDKDYDNYTTELGNFLRENEGNNDLKIILNLKRVESKSTVLHLLASTVDRMNSRVALKCMGLLMQAGDDADIQDGRGKTPREIAIDKEYSLESTALWNNLMLEQQKKLEASLREVIEAKNMNELERVVKKVIDSGVRLNLLSQGNLYGKVYENKYGFADYVIKKIRELKNRSKVEKDMEVGSGIVCTLMSRGAILYNIISVCN